MDAVLRCRRRPIPFPDAQAEDLLPGPAGGPARLKMVTVPRRPHAGHPSGPVYSQVRSLMSKVGISTFG